MTTNQPVTDIVTALAADHRLVEEMLGRITATDKAQLEEQFRDLTNLLVRHEIAEEEIVYPALRKDAPGGEAIAEARIHEQSEAEEMLKKMEKMEVDSTEFIQSLQKLKAAVLEHAQHEEREVFPLLAEYEDNKHQVSLADRYEKAKKAAPTHPHPMAPDKPPGNLVLGPVAALADRMRDAIRTSS